MTSNIMPKRISFFLEVLALISFLLALWLLWQDRTSSAGVAVALSFGAILFRVLPTLESFEILGLKAKLRERIEEADEVLNRLRQVASIVTKTAVVNTTWSSRMGGIPYDKQAELLDSQERELVALNVPRGIIDDVKRPALEMVSFDLAYSFVGVIERATKPYSDAYGRVRTNLRNPNYVAQTPESTARFEWATERQSSYANGRYRDIVASVRDRPESLAALLREVTELYRWSAVDRVALDRLAVQISGLNSKVWSTGRMDEAAGRFLREDRGTPLFEPGLFTEPCSAGVDWRFRGPRRPLSGALSWVWRWLAE